MESLSAEERRQIEVELLQAMYPGQVHYEPNMGEFKYDGSIGGSMTLRLPEPYPDRGLPDLIGATDQLKNDLRQQTNAAFHDMRLIQGEEILDAMVQVFEEVLEMHAQAEASPSQVAQLQRFRTVVVWLHHLLNTEKRKLALNPTTNAAVNGQTIAGITKPGYPGMLVYSGPADLVDAHVTELRQQRWQAFQIRYDETHEKEQGWQFTHGHSIVEVESMSDVVQGIVDQLHREQFLQAAGVK